MAYQTYTTEAVVCGSYDRGTADRSYRLFTKDAGMLFATARSVREEKSKQRFALQDFSVIRVSLVKGKNGWRIGSVEVTGNPFLGAQSRGSRGSIVGAFKVINRFLHGEEPHPDIFSELKAFLLAAPDFADEKRGDALMVLELRVLTALGYVSVQKSIQLIIDSPGEYTFPASDGSNSLMNTVKTVVGRGREVSHL